MGRIRDAVKTLMGRSEAQIELGRMRADWTSLMLDVSNAMEKMKTAALKLAKRDARELGDTFAGEPARPSAEQPSGKWAMRAEILKRKKAGQPINIVPEAIQKEMTGNVESDKTG